MRRDFAVAVGITTSTPNQSCEQIPLATGSTCDVSIVEPTSLHAIHILDHSTESPIEYKCCTHSGPLLFVIEPSDKCPCYNEELWLREEEQKDSTFVKEEEMDMTNVYNSKEANPSLGLVHLLNRSTQSPEEYESCMQEGGQHYTAGRRSLFLIEPSDKCPCSYEKLSLQEGKQKDSTFIKEEDTDASNEHNSTNANLPLVPVRLLDHSTQSPEECDSCMQEGGYHYTAGRRSLFFIEPVDECPCSNEKLSLGEEKQKDSTFIKEEMNTSNEHNSTNAIVRKYSNIFIHHPLVPVHLLDHSTQSPEDYESCMQEGGQHYTADRRSLFLIEPADKCPCSFEKLSLEEEKQKDSTFIKEEKSESRNEDFDMPLMLKSPTDVERRCCDDCVLPLQKSTASFTGIGHPRPLKPSLEPVHIRENNMESNGENNCSMRSSSSHFTSGRGSLFIIEPREKRVRYDEKLSLEGETQKDDIFVKQENFENKDEEFDVNACDTNAVSRPSSEPILLLENSAVSNGENESCRHQASSHLTPGRGSLFILEPAEKERFCHDEKLSFKEKTQKDNTFVKEENIEKMSEEFDMNACDINAQGSVGGRSADGSLAPPDVEGLQSKLLATMQILENKEETIRVQAQSLAIAEARIAELTSRAKSSCPPSPKTTRGVDPCLIEKADLSTNTNLYQEGRRHEKIVATLQDNLSVIEELYKECFYETAKQDELINSLRDSFAEVRLMEKDKTEQIGRMQKAFNAQKWSLGRHQDIAMEVESLKSDISNYLYNSNYDSGVWERDEAAGMRGERGPRKEGADLCMNECKGLKDDNAELQEANKYLGAQADELHLRVQHLETTLQDKCRENAQYQQRLDLKEKEFLSMSQRLGVVEKSWRDQSIACDSLTERLQQLQKLLTEKSAQLMQLQQQCDARESSALELQRRLDEAQRTVQREHEAYEEAKNAAQGAGEWRRRCQERTSSMSRLRAQLREAQGRGARLCAETQGLLASLRSCLHRYKTRMREQQEKIREQDGIIRSLRQSPNKKSASTCYDEPSCSRYIQREKARHDDSASEISSCTKWLEGQRKKEKTDAPCSIFGCSKCIHSVGVKQRVEQPTSGSETTSSRSPPKPPRRLKKTQFVDDCTSQSSGRSRDAIVQRPERCDATIGTGGRGKHSHCSRCSPTKRAHYHELCSAEQMLERVSATREALHASHLRWSRHSHSRDSTHSLPHHDHS